MNHTQRGFTLIELLMVMGLFAILSSLVVVNLIRPQAESSTEAVSLVLVSDIKLQQLRSMIGDTEGTGTAQQYGIYFESDGYTLFRGGSFSPSDPSNFKIAFKDPTIVTNIQFPSSELVFTLGSGDVSGFVDGSNSITVRHGGAGLQQTITVNRYGAITTN